MKEKTAGHLTECDVESLATAFAAIIPENEFSPAEIQGKYRTRPDVIILIGSFFLQVC